MELVNGQQGQQEQADQIDPRNLRGDSGGERENFAGGQAGTGGIGGEFRSEPESIPGSIGQAQLLGATNIVGGIIARMIAEKKERIREVDECVDWYVREKTRRLSELEELEALSEQLSEAAAPAPEIAPTNE